MTRPLRGVERLVALAVLAALPMADPGEAQVHPDQGPERSDLALVEPAVIAHRGASGHAPEHTFLAWDLALEMGADYLEQDLQMTADGVLVVLHDETLDRTARGPGCTGPVAERTRAELMKCEVGSWFDPELSGPAVRIPTLAEVLERYRGRARFHIETKRPEEAPGMEEALVAELAAAGLLPARPGDPSVLVQSFSDESLRRLARIAPQLPRVQLLTRRAGDEDPERLLARIAEYAQGVGPNAALVDEAFMSAARRHGLLVHPWTVNDPEEMDRLLGLGVDGIFTDLPDLLLRRLAAEGG